MRSRGQFLCCLSAHLLPRGTKWDAAAHRVLTDCVSQGGGAVRTPHKIAWELMGTTWKISPLVSEEDVTTPDSLAMPGLGTKP